MKITLIRTDRIYEKMMNASPEARDDLFRYEMMKPFEFKWACIHVPMKAKTPGGYDVVMACEMLGYLSPSKVDISQKENIRRIADPRVWQTCHDTIERALNRFTDAGYSLPEEEYRFALLLANPDSPYIAQSEGYGGDGGIPGYILVGLVPSDHTIERLPAALSHECNHNVRFQYQKWHPDITLGEMIVCEGLAENFAVILHGEDHLGPWVTKTDLETLNEYIKPIMRWELHQTGFDNITAYLYGDEFAKLQGYFPVGMPYCAGYACGYHLIRHYLETTGVSIEEATLKDASEILSVSENFWDEITRG